MSLADDIFAIDDLVREKVEIPEWKMTLYVRTMTGLERDDFENWIGKNTRDGHVDLRTMRARLTVLCLVDSKGNRVFSNDQLEQVAAKSGLVLGRVSEIATRLNGLSGEDIEDLAEN